MQSQSLTAVLLSTTLHAAHAVVVLIDVTRRETFEYVKTLLPEVPHKLPVLLLASFRDAPDARRTVRFSEIEKYADAAAKERVRHGDGRRVQVSSYVITMVLEHLSFSCLADI